MDIKEDSNSNIQVINSNSNEFLSNNKEKYSDIVNQNTSNNLTYKSPKMKSQNIQQLQYELLSSKTNNNINNNQSFIGITNNNSREDIQDNNPKVEETIEQGINFDLEKKQTKNEENEFNVEEVSLKDKKFKGSSIIINHEKKNDDISIFSREGELISPIEKIKVIDSFIHMNPLPTPSSTPAPPSSDYSSNSSSPTLLPPNSGSPPPLEINTNDTTNKSELSFSIQQKIQNELIKIYKDILPTKQSKQNRLLLLEKIQNIFDNEFPGKPIKAHLFGSSVNGLETVYCDVDICLTTPSKEDNYGLDRMDRIAMILEKYNMTEIYTVQEAKVPICKFVDPETNLSCDINVNNTVALENTMMVRTYALIDERAQQLIILIKHYAKRRMINDAKGGTLSSYCWVNMTINFLQQRQPPILPCLHELGKNNSEEEQIIIDGVDCTFYHDLDSLKDFGKSNKETLADLFFEFFKLYGEEFDYRHHVVSVRKGEYISKYEKGWHLDGKKTKLRNNYFCVEEPFNPSRNLANSADHSSISGLKDEFLRALSALRNHGDVDRVFEQYRPFRRPFNPYPGSGFNSVTRANYVNNNSYNIVAAANNTLSTALYNGVLYPVLIPSSNYSNYQQYNYPQPLYLVQPSNNLYTYNSGDEENGGYYSTNEHYSDISPNPNNHKFPSKSNSFKYSNGNNNKKKKKKYSNGNKNHLKMNSADSSFNYNKNDHDQEPLSLNSNGRFGFENNNNSSYSIYQNPYILGYDRFSNHNGSNPNGNISNGKINYSISSPKSPVIPIPYAYNSPILSPTSSFSSYSMSSSSMPNLFIDNCTYNYTNNNSNTNNTSTPLTNLYNTINNKTTSDIDPEVNSENIDVATPSLSNDDEEKKRFS